MWVLQIPHQTKLFPDPSGSKKIMDSFFTPHTLVQALKQMVGGEARIVETVKFSKIDSKNKRYALEGITKLLEYPRGL